jgi:hypothetical protein
MARPALGLARPELEEAAEVEEPACGSGGRGQREAGSSGRDGDGMLRLSARASRRGVCDGGGGCDATPGGGASLTSDRVLRVHTCGRTKHQGAEATRLARSRTFVANGDRRRRTRWRRVRGVRAEREPRMHVRQNGDSGHSVGRRSCSRGKSKKLLSYNKM